MRAAPRARGLLAAMGALAGLAASGCGYALLRDAAAPVAGLRAVGPPVAIVTPDNRSNEPGLDRIVAQALRREWLRRGSLRLEEDPQRAQWVLAGSVLPLRTSTPTLSSVVLALEHSVTLSLALELRGPDGRERSLPAALLTETEVYLASADLEALRRNRSEALRRVAAVLAQRAFDAVAAEVAP